MLLLLQFNDLCVSVVLLTNFSRDKIDKALTLDFESKIQGS